jgi:hypothetical protein
MKRILLLTATVVLALATAASAEIKVTGDAYIGVFDKYLWRGIDFSGSTPVAQGGMDLSANNVTLSYWTNTQLKTDEGYEGGDANETDITLNYALPVGELLTLNAGNIYYTFDGAADTNELYLAATLNTLLAPTLKGYYDWDEFKDARFYTLSIGHSLALGKVTLTGGALASYSDGDGAHEPWNAELSAKADIAVTDQIKVTPSFIYSTPLANDAQDAIDTEMASGLTVTLTF